MSYQVLTQEQRRQLLAAYQEQGLVAAMCLHATLSRRAIETEIRREISRQESRRKRAEEAARVRAETAAKLQAEPDRPKLIEAKPKPEPRENTERIHNDPPPDIIQEMCARFRAKNYAKMVAMSDLT